MSNTKDTPMDYKLSREQMESQITEMWDAVSGISGEDAHEAIEQAYETEARLRKAFDEQEKLRDSAPDLLKENQELKLELQKQKEKEILGDRMIVDLEHQKTILKSELEKQKELNAELVKSVESLIEILRSFENMEALGPLESFRMREIESLIKKSSEV